jgi:DNA replication protein DnaC
VTLRLVNSDDFLPTSLAKLQKTYTERRAKYGWPVFVEDTFCNFCGETGINPDNNTFCLCPVGMDLARSSARTEQWGTVVPHKFQGFTFASHPNTELASEVAHWVATDPVEHGTNLVIQGGTGQGKTGAAIAALRDLHFAGHIVRYANLPDLMDQFREENKVSPRAEVKAPAMPWLVDCDCLLLDDMGAERPNPFVTERLYVLINGRYVNGKPTIITTNHVGKKLDDYFGERIASRIEENHVEIVGRRQWPDLRRKGSK